MSATAQYAVFDRYIDALLSTAPASKSHTLWLEQAQAFAKAMTIAPELARALADPRISAANKEAVIATIADRIQIEKHLKRAILLFVRKGRAADLAGLANRLVQRLKKELGIVVANVTAAKDLTPAQSQDLSRALGENVELHTTIDPTLLGGLIVQIDSWRMDDSIKGKLDRLARRLNKAA